MTADRRPALTYLVSADYSRTTGGWIYNERLLAELAAQGWRIDRRELPPGFPEASHEARAAALTILRALPDGMIVLADQICLSPLAEGLAAEAGRLRLVIILHHPQILEGSRAPEVAESMDREERLAVKLSHLVLATSPLTARQLREGYDVEPGRLVMAEPGMDVFPPSRGSSGKGPVQLLSVGSVIPRKRHELILTALGGLSDLDWRLTLVGNVAWAGNHVYRLRRLIVLQGLEGRVQLAGEKSGPELADLWSAADIYAAASAHEGFGLAIAEAVARAIPVVSTYSGAVGEWLPREAGIIAEPDDMPTLRSALRSLIADAGLRARYAEGAKAARGRLATWPQTAEKVAAALRGL